MNITEHKYLIFIQQNALNVTSVWMSLILDDIGINLEEHSISLVWHGWNEIGLP